MVVRTPNWVVYQQRLDKLLDLRMAEPVELHPWITGSGYSTDGVIDTSRPVLKTQAIFVTPGAQVIGESGSSMGGVQQLENEAWISIQEDLLGDPASWKAHERVYLPIRNSWYEIAYISPSATRRPDIHLIRLESP